MIKKLNILLLIFCLVPRPPFDAGSKLSYPIIAMILVMIILTKKYKKVNIDLRFILIFISFIALILLSSISILVNNTAISSLSYIMRVGFILLAFIYGYIDFYNKDIEKFKTSILRTINLVLVVEIAIVITQLFDIRVFHYFYSMNKTLPLGTLVRVAGTFGNPNLFGWVIIQFSILFLLLESNLKKRILKIFICLILVFLSGSRVSLLVFFAAQFVVLLKQQKKDIVFLITKFPFIIIMGVISVSTLFLFLYRYQEYFPYMGQIFSVFTTKNLSSVNSFSLRQEMWLEASMKFDSYQKSTKYLLGMGPGTMKVLDNDYLFSMYNYGFLFSLIQYSPYIYMTIKGLFTRKSSWLVLILFEYGLFSLITGYQSETMSGWEYPIIFFYLFGVYLSYSFRERRKS
ncbi:O-antigen ligase family protein [Vagococcus teuberi]|uniref:Uncharacterized protein n=1 Tax=Vagococcus teuberi TaxID=519472 RepID=A0A1J0A740_9ENTE|nr:MULTISPECIES: O-antigen ligase family protein [Vagococcus]APB31739.1 hypothetical protein BHY08_07815 [Vagococcus teuberi]RHH71579.1 hypothetical protein DW196_03355 [Vagococcus sp. AM17-17]